MIKEQNKEVKTDFRRLTDLLINIRDTFEILPHFPIKITTFECFSRRFRK